MEIVKGSSQSFGQNSENRYLKFFWALVALEIIAVFFLNHKHTAEQGVYNLYLQVAREWMQTGSYAMGGEALFHPLWGYTALVVLSGFSSFILLAVQAGFGFLAVFIFYRAYILTPRMWHLLAIFPFVAVCSIKWPNAVTAILAIFYIDALRRFVAHPSAYAAFYGGAMAGLAALMRPEAWIWPVVTLAAAALPATNKRRIAAFAVIIVAAQVLFMAPWSLRAYNHTGKWLLTPTYGGFLAFISLGQDPQNPWGIKHSDAYGRQELGKLGVKNPYSPKADEVLRKKFFALVAQNPGAYLRKMGVNFKKFLKHGIFVGQVFTLKMEKGEYEESFKKIVGGKALDVVKELPPGKSFLLFTHLFLDAAYRIMFLALWAAAFAAIFLKLKNRSPFEPVHAFSIAMAAAAVLLTVLLQYQPRHLNIIWLPLFGTVMSLYKERNTPLPDNR